MEPRETALCNLPSTSTNGAEFYASPPWKRRAARLRAVARSFVSEATVRDWRMPPRPWSEFFGRFSVPWRTRASWLDRVSLNSHTFQTNYCIIVGAALVYYVVRRPWAIFVVGASIVSWVHATSPTPFLVSGRRITRRERFAAATSITTILFLLSGILGSFVLLLLWSALIFLCHASFRHTAVHAKFGDLTDRKNNW